MLEKMAGREANGRLPRCILVKLTVVILPPNLVEIPARAVHVPLSFFC